MREDWPVTIPDGGGEWVEVDVLRDTGRVYLGTSSPGVLLDAAAQEKFAQAWVAACHEVERQGTGPATDPPLHHDEGITGMYWDNLGSVGDG